MEKAEEEAIFDAVSREQNQMNVIPYLGTENKELAVYAVFLFPIPKDILTIITHCCKWI